MNDERRARYARCGIVAILCCEWGCRIPGEQIPGEPWGVGSEALLGGFGVMGSVSRFLGCIAFGVSVLIPSPWLAVA